jgi:hypothetical protein
MDGSTPEVPAAECENGRQHMPFGLSRMALIEATADPAAASVRRAGFGER